MKFRRVPRICDALFNRYDGERCGEVERSSSLRPVAGVRRYDAGAVDGDERRRACGGAGKGAVHYRLRRVHDRRAILPLRDLGGGSVDANDVDVRAVGAERGGARHERYGPSECELRVQPCARHAVGAVRCGHSTIAELRAVFEASRCTIGDASESSSRCVVAYKGGDFERDLLTVMGVYRVDLGTLGCPKTDDVLANAKSAGRLASRCEHCAKIRLRTKKGGGVLHCSRIEVCALADWCCEE